MENNLSSCNRGGSGWSALRGETETELAIVVNAEREKRTGRARESRSRRQRLGWSVEVKTTTDAKYYSTLMLGLYIEG